MIRRSYLSLLSLLALGATSQASIVIAFSARTAADAAGTPLVAGTLVQLVNLGADGVFNQITLADGNVSALGQWVSGDDTLINVAYLNPGGAAGDFASAAAFDLANGNDSIAGRISHQFEFDFNTIPTGAKLGIRWFPGLQATNYYLPGSITLAAGQPYGEFTRQSTPLNGGDLWVFPGDLGNVTFDGLKTPDIGGLDSANSAKASNVVLAPEPGTAALALLGAAGFFGLRRRRS